MHLVYPKNNFQNYCFQFLLGITVIPIESEIKDILGRGGNHRAFGFTCMCKINLACWGKVPLNRKHDTVSDG